VAPGNWEEWSSSRRWLPRRCDADTNRMAVQPTCSIEITDEHYMWIARVHDVQPGLWVKEGFDQLLINRRSGVANFRQYGGTYKNSGENSHRDTVLVGRCSPAEDPASQPPPAQLF
jgi:hypothetical protein